MNIEWNPTPTELFLFLLAKAGINPECFAYETENGKVVLSSPMKHFNDDEECDGDCESCDDDCEFDDVEDPVFDAACLIVDEADNETLLDAYHLIATEMAERGMEQCL